MTSSKRNSKTTAIPQNPQTPDPAAPPVQEEGSRSEQPHSDVGKNQNTILHQSLIPHDNPQETPPEPSHPGEINLVDQKPLNTTENTEIAISKQEKKQPTTVPDAAVSTAQQERNPPEQPQCDAGTKPSSNPPQGLAPLDTHEEMTLDSSHPPKLSVPDKKPQTSSENEDILTTKAKQRPPKTIKNVVAENRMLLVTARDNLALVWFGGAAPTFVLLAAQSLSGRFETNVQDVFSWWCTTTVPTLSLILGVLAVTAYHSSDARTVRRKFHDLVWWLSLFYVMMVLAVVLVQPATKTAPLELFRQSSIFLTPLQGLAAAGIGALFTQQKEK